MQHRKAPKSAGSTEPISPVLPGIFPVWVLFGSNQISKNSIYLKSDGKQEKALGFPKKSEGWWSECRDSNPGPLGPEDSAEKSGGAFRPVWFCLFQQKVLSSLLHSNAYVRSPHSLGHYLGQTAIPLLHGEKVLVLANASHHMSTGQIAQDEKTRKEIHSPRAYQKLLPARDKAANHPNLQRKKQCYNSGSGI